MGQTFYVKQEVIRDLLPLFLANELSHETRQLVEEYLTREPEFARSVRALSEDLSTLEEPVICSVERVQQASFQRTRTVVQRDNILLGFGIAYLIAPFSFMFSGTHITWFMIRNNPFQALFFVAAGVICLLLRLYLKHRKADWTRS